MSLNLLGALCSRVGGMIILLSFADYIHERHQDVELIEDLSDF